MGLVASKGPAKSIWIDSRGRKVLKVEADPNEGRFPLAISHALQAKGPVLAGIDPVIWVSPWVTVCV